MVAGILYKFDLVLEHNQDDSECQQMSSGGQAEVCHMVVWDKPWEQYREVQWDQVDCEPQPTSAAPLIGGGDHDFVPHSSESSLLGGGDHDLVPHGSPANLLGGDGHDSQPHGEANSPAKLLRVGLKKVQAAVRLGLVLPPTGEVAQPLLGAGDHDFLPHVKKASKPGLLGAQAHGPRFDSEYMTKELLERKESKQQLKELQVIFNFNWWGLSLFLCAEHWPLPRLYDRAQQELPRQSRVQAAICNLPRQHEKGAVPPRD